jgi:hypothetical protein
MAKSKKTVDLINEIEPINITPNNLFTINNDYNVTTSVVTLGGISNNEINDCEWCFQFDDEDPIVFAVGASNAKDPFVQFKLTNKDSSNVEFTDNKNKKKFKLFARKKS